MFVFGRFAIVGSIGFLTDAFTFYLLSENALTEVDMARIYAFVIAMIMTWLGNRYFTFSAARNAKAGIQFMKHTGCALLGFSINFIIFKSLIGLNTHLAIAFVTGVFAAMISNFFISKHLVFSN